MIGQKCLFLGIVALIVLVPPVTLSKNRTSKEWATSAQKSIWEVSQIFHRATIGTGGFDKEIHKNIAALSQSTAKVAGLFGVFGALFSIAMAFIPGSESPEIKLMRTEFNKLSQKVDAIASSLKETKKLIKVEAQRAAYVGHEHKILHGHSQLKICLEKLNNVACSGLKDCKRKKVLVAEGYIASMNVQENVETILKGVTDDGAFGKSLLFLIKEESECNVPKINRFMNKIVALITNGIQVSMFYDLMTKTDYNVLDGTVMADEMLRTLNSRHQSIQDECFQKFDYWMTLDVENSQEEYQPDIHVTNTNLLRTLKRKYPWIYWHVVTYNGKNGPETGPSNTPRRHLYSSSKTHNVHSFVIPSNTAEPGNLRKMTKKWKNIVKSISSDPKRGVQDIEYILKRDFTLENKIQSFAILPGNRWVFGHYNDEIKQRMLGLNDASAAKCLCV